MHDDVTVRMAAPVEQVWALVSDVTRIGEFSPETFEAEWLGGATGPAVGARFRGHVKRNGRGPTYWSECVVTECVPNRTFEFGVELRGDVVNTWRYELVDEGDSTAVTESFTLASTIAMKMYWAVLGWARGRTNRIGMQTTLERIRAVVEGDRIA